MRRMKEDTRTMYQRERLNRAARNELVSLKRDIELFKAIMDSIACSSIDEFSIKIKELSVESYRFHCTVREYVKLIDKYRGTDYLRKVEEGRACRIKM